MSVTCKKAGTLLKKIQQVKHWYSMGAFELAMPVCDDRCILSLFTKKKKLGAPRGSSTCDHACS